MFVGQSGLMNFTLYARGDGCNVKQKRASLQLEDKKVFSAVVEISNNEFILKKVSESCCLACSKRRTPVLSN